MRKTFFNPTLGNIELFTQGLQALLRFDIKESELIKDVLLE